MDYDDLEGGAGPIDRLFIRGIRKDAGSIHTEEKINIAVTGLGQNVGTTFVASSLAFFFAEKGNSLTFTQCVTPRICNSLLYDSVAMDQRFRNRDFHDFYQLVEEGAPIKGKQNLEKDVNWILPTPDCCEKSQELSQEQKARLIYRPGGQICIFDLEPSAGWDRFLIDMDLILVVVDPLPSKMIRHSGRYRMLKQLELAGTHVLWIVNRANEGISRRQVSGYLRSNQLLYIEEFPQQIIYADEFACRFHWENPDIKCKLMEAFTKVSHGMGVS